MKRVRSTLAAAAAVTMLVAGCGRSDDSTEATDPPAAPTTAAPVAPDTTNAGTATTTAGGGSETTAAPDVDVCASEPLEATEVGVSATEITIEVMADTGSALAPGLFQANVDGIKAFADHVNEQGGVGCRQLVVRSWDSKLDANEAKNGLIDACQNAVMMVGGNSLFNPDPSPMDTCADLTGAPTGLPNISAIATDVNELCSPMTFTIQQVKEICPITVGEPREFTELVGPFRRILETTPELHGLFMVAGDLPTTRQSAISMITAQEELGIVHDGIVLASGRDEQSVYTPRVQILKQNESNFVYNGLDETAMTKLQKEAAAQGVDMESINWMCGLSCYTADMLQSPSTAEGTKIWLNFLPFEEADTNAELQAYIDAVGFDNAESFGAQAWQAGVAFKQVVDEIVATDGPNGITRAALLEALENLDDFTANGWSGERSLRNMSSCYMLLEVRDGEFQRVFPEERGTLHCDPDNLLTVTAEPVSAAADLG